MLSSDFQLKKKKKLNKAKYILFIIFLFPKYFKNTCWTLFNVGSLCSISWRRPGSSPVHDTINITFHACSWSAVSDVFVSPSGALSNDDKASAAHQSWARCGGSYPGWLWSRNTTTSAGTVGPPSSGTRASCLPPRENISMRKGGEGSGCRGRINPWVRIGA